MKRLLIELTALLVLPVLGAAHYCAAQSMDDLNLQIHGYATQGFVYSTDNNWNTTNSTDGSAAWSEAVVNLAAQPQSRLRVGVQARYCLLGDYGNAITLDWAQADYKFNEKLGFRVGKVKTPTGLLNDTQDIDPAYLWVLLPQSIYPIASRSSMLAHFGGLVYGTVSLGQRLGRIEYRAFAGQLVIPSNDGMFQPLRNAGLELPNGTTGPVLGGALHWNTPLPGLMLGASDNSEHVSGRISVGPMQANFTTSPFNTINVFGRYEHGNAMIAAEYERLDLHPTILLPGVPQADVHLDKRSFYGMASYKLATKLTGGLYYSSLLDRKAAFTSSRYQKDWALSVRYDFDPLLYLKVEQHFVDGTEFGYSTSNNADGLKPNSRMTLLKLGVSF